MADRGALPRWRLVESAATLRRGLSGPRLHRCSRYIRLRSEPSGRQIFRTKSIDKLISESEEPEHALKKSLGPGLLPRSASAPSSAPASSPSSALRWRAEVRHCLEVSNTPLIDLPGLRHTAMAGRPGAGPALALSLVLVAIVCALYRPLLRRTGLDDPHRRLGLHLHLRHARRTGGVDHRLGSDPRVRLLQHERQRRLRRAYRGAAGLVRHPSRPRSGSRRPICRPACRTCRATTSTHPAGTSASTFRRS